MNCYELIESFLNNKRKQNLTLEEIEMCDYIQDLITDKKVFYYLDNELLNGIFKFIGVPKEQANALYNELTSPENYLKTHEKERIMY